MPKIILIISLLIINCNLLIAQDEVDALRYSSQDVFGSARFVSMGGAFGALGADFSCASYNPAGIGMYQFNEFSITPSFNLNTSSSYFKNEKSDESKLAISLDNIGFVWSSPYKSTKWKRINFAFGWNQVNNYNKNIYIQGYNHQNSLVNSILDRANGIHYNEISDPYEGYLYAGPAWGAYLIDTISQANGMSYTSAIITNTRKKQTRQLDATGGSGEFVFSLGTSYEDDIYIGGTIGVPTINYYQQTNHIEDSFGDTLEVLIDGATQKMYGFNYADELTVSGYGFNLKIGAIVRASENIKVGIALHSPTIYNIKEEFSTGIATYLENEDITSYSLINRFEYRLLTPWKGILSASTSMRNILLGIDYELVDYAFMKYDFGNYNKEEEIIINDNIKNTYVRTNNIRVGAEVRFKFLSVRTGYSLYGSPISKKDDYIKKNLTFGIGITNGRYYLDGGYILSMNKETYLIYGEESSTIANTKHNFIISLGIKY